MADATGPSSRYVVTLVHGTWAYGLPELVRLRRFLGRPAPAIWTDDASPFCRDVIEYLTVDGEPPIIRRFEWSGRNQVRARAEAAEELLTDLRQVRTEWPDARHVVVAHSHGGSVALYALRDAGAEAAKLVERLVCLATPFIHSRDRPITPSGDAGFLFLTLPLFGLCFLAFSPFVAFPDLTAETQPHGPMFLYFWLPLGLGLWASARWGRLLHRVRAATALPQAPAVPVLLVRGDGDEATGALALGSFVAAFTARVWLRVQALEGANVSTPRQGAARWPAMSLLLVLMVMLLTTSYAVITQTLATVLAAVPLSETARGILDQFLAPVLLLGGVIYLGTWGLAGPVAARVGSVIAVLLWPLWVLLLLPFGWEIALCSPFLDVFVEPTPPGRWTIHHLESPSAWETAELARPVRHSFLHDDPRASAAAVAWIRQHQADAGRRAWPECDGAEETTAAARSAGQQHVAPRDVAE